MTHPTQAAGAATLTDEQIGNMLSDLDEIARDEDHYDYGLPMWDEPLAKMRAVVQSYLAPSAPTEHVGVVNADGWIDWIQDGPADWEPGTKLYLQADPSAPDSAAPSSVSAEPGYVDDLEMRLAEAVEERDHLRKALKYWRDECSGAEPSISVFERMVDEAITPPAPAAAPPAVSAEPVANALADLRAAVVFLDQVRAAPAEEDATRTGAFRDAREWLEKAARAALAQPQQGTGSGS